MYGQIDSNELEKELENILKGNIGINEISKYVKDIIYLENNLEIEKDPNNKSLDINDILNYNWIIPIIMDKSIVDENPNISILLKKIYNKNLDGLGFNFNEDQYINKIKPYGFPDKKNDNQYKNITLLRSRLCLQLSTENGLKNEYENGYK